MVGNLASNMTACAAPERSDLGGAIILRLSVRPAANTRRDDADGTGARLPLRRWEVPSGGRA
jgi:hypothetical protein